MESQKHLFTLDPNIHYLNCAYKSPLLKTAEEASIQALVKNRNPAQLKSIDFFSEVDKVRQLYAAIISCLPANVAIIPSSSYGFASILSNIKGKKNGKGITIHDEFPSGYFALQKWCENNENHFQVVSADPSTHLQGESWNANILASIDDNTSVVLISAIHWMNGLKFDLEAIGKRCEEVGAYFVVDGSQSVGALPMDVNKYNIDALICASYKWLFGPYSIALLYVSDKFEHGNPIEESWMNRSNAKDFSNLTSYKSSYFPKAGRYNVGQASNLISMPILKEGLNQLTKWGIDSVQEYGKELIQPLKLTLSKMNIELEAEQYFSNHLFSLKLPEYIDAQNFKTQLQNDNIVISVRGDYIRVSVNLYNDASDISALIKVLENNHQ